MKTVRVRMAVTALFVIGVVTSGWPAPPSGNSREKAPPDEIPRVEMSHVPLREAIRNLARQAELNYILDPALSGPWRGRDGKLVDEPELTFQWRNLTALDALRKVLKDHHLEMVENPVTSVTRIVPAGKRAERKGAEQLTISAGESIPLVVIDDLPLLAGITRLASQAHLIPTLDAEISPVCFEMVLEQAVSVRWQNITASQALTALFDNYGLLLKLGPDGKSARICIDPETEAEVKKLAAARNGPNSHAGPGSAPSWPEEDLYHQLTSESKSNRALNRVLKTPEEFSAGILCVSSSVALRLHRLEDAGFLFYAGQIRAEFDKALFPPIGRGGDNPLVALGVLRVQLGNRLSPALMAEPQLFARVSAKVKSWKPRVPPGFEPGWDYSRKGNLKQAEGAMADTRTEIVSQLGELSMLLQDATYFAAFKTAQDYNLKVAGESSRPTKAAYDSACQAMEQVEKEKQIVGFAAAIKSGVARSDAEVPQPGQPR